MEKEPIYFYLTGNWYKGKMPNFYDVEKLSTTPILRENYPAIKEEVMSFFTYNADKFKPNATPHAYYEAGWKNMSLYAFGLRFSKNIKHFPVLDKVARSIPHMISAQIAVLEPNTRVKAHFGDTNAIIRSHLGLVVPGEYPELGFRNGSQEQCWKEGDVLAICISHRHYVWNYTPYKRVVVILDTIHPDYVTRKYYIAGGLLASQTMKILTTRFSWLRKTPDTLTILIHRLLTVPFSILLLVQNYLKIDVARYVMRLR